MDLSRHNSLQPLTSLKCVVLVPAFNESASIGTLAERLHRTLPGVDLLVIDDGSTDHTVRSVPPYVKVISLPFNLGIGGAMQTGYRYAALNGYDVAIQVDGDGQHRPSEVARLVEVLVKENADVVVGSRFLSGIRYRQTFVRMTGILVLGMLIRLLSGLHVTDCTSGFRAVNRRVLRAFAHWYPEDYPEPEVVLLLHRNGFKIAETPVRMRQRRGGVTSIPLFKGITYMVKVTSALLLDMARAPWPRGKVEEHESTPQSDPDRVRWEPAAAGGSSSPSIQA
jgi:glycosyltransferase involved in cell wall biosynthesis